LRFIEKAADNAFGRIYRSQSGDTARLLQFTWWAESASRPTALLTGSMRRRRDSGGTCEALGNPLEMIPAILTNLHQNTRKRERKTRESGCPTFMGVGVPGHIVTTSLTRFTP
jgi:hypothetical protein